VRIEKPDIIPNAKSVGIEIERIRPWAAFSVPPITNLQRDGLVPYRWRAIRRRINASGCR
jgi:hypothetical protein